MIRVHPANLMIRTPVSLIVLLTIKSGISLIEKQLRKLLAGLKRAPSWSSDDDIMETGTVNRVFLKRDQEMKESQENSHKK